MAPYVWRRWGLIWAPDPSAEWSRSHAAVPTPLLIQGNLVRVFVSPRDSRGRSRTASFDVLLSEEPTVVASSERPLIDIGKPGRFDQDGVMCTSVVRLERGQLLMHYAGFELLSAVRYRIMVGAAISEDEGQTFHRVSEVPVLDRVDGESLFRGGPFVSRITNGYEMLYVGGEDWVDIDGKLIPSYSLRRIHSADAMQWDEPAETVLPSTENFVGYGRPWPFRHPTQGSKLLVSVRDVTSKRYRMAVAQMDESRGFSDVELGIGLEPQGGGFESHDTIFAATVEVEGRIWCFYNGNNFGSDGVALAELVLE